MIRALYVYSNVEIEARPLEQRALYTYSDIAIESLSVAQRALYAYSDVEIEDLTVAQRALYAYARVTNLLAEDTPLEIQLLDSSWDMESILRPK